MLPGIREAALWKQTLHNGISYDATKNPQNGGVCYARAPGDAFKYGHLTDIFTFTGDNKSYFMGPAGLLVPSITNTPRIEYDSIGNILGLLIEGGRTNGLLWSRDQTNAAWVKTTMTAAKDQIGVDGVSNGASSLLATAANALSLQTIVQAAVSSTFSFWAKRLVGSGTVGIAQDGATFTTIALTTSWQRFTLTATQLNPTLGFKIVTNTDKIAVDFGQFEAGAFVSSAIPTTTVAVTRAAETCSRTFGSEYSAIAGTVLLEYDLIGLNSAGQYPVYLGNAGRHIYHGNTLTPKIYDGTTVLSAASSVTLNVMSKVASNYGTDGLAISRNGNIATAAYDGTWGAGETTLQFGLSVGEEVWGHIRRFDYWPERKSNAFLQNITGA